MNRPGHITILGGGAAGLAVGYYAKKSGLPFALYEATDRVGGNCATLTHGDFRFDSGAHRFHDVDAEVTREVKQLLGEELRHINIPSQIYHNGKYVGFPLSPLNLLRGLGPATFAKAAVEVLRARLRRGQTNSSFESFALNTYGKTIAQRFLLGYSEKLWGLPCRRLSVKVAGRRLKGLDLRTFLLETVLTRKAATGHLDGSFLYPRTGIAAIMEALASFCGREHIVRSSRITAVRHNGKRIQAVEVNAGRTVETDEVVSSLPLDRFVRMLIPAPPQDVLRLADRLRFRNLVLVAIFLDTESITEAATVYFPAPDIPFTRVYEPKNRSADASPAGKTSLVAEIPCSGEHRFWRMEDAELVQLVRGHLVRIGWISGDEIIGSCVRRMNYAYPVLEKGSDRTLAGIRAYLGRLGNLRLCGRNGRFVYVHVHDLMRSGREIVESYAAGPGAGAPPAEAPRP